jgi:hypothetical protein
MSHFVLVVYVSSFIYEQRRYRNMATDNCQ